MDRILERGIMDVGERAAAYGAANFSEVNGAFVDRLLALASSLDGALVLDQGAAHRTSLRRCRWTARKTGRTK